jgi:hypothetical protein
MHASQQEMTTVLAAGDASIRGLDWDGMRVVIMKIPAGTDFTPLLKGLPGDRCPCPHWGYVLKGRLRIEDGDGEYAIEAGDVFYLPPGHTAFAEVDSECFEVSPSALNQTFVEAVRKNTRLH